MNQFLATIDKPETGTVFNKYPQEFVNSGYPTKIAAQFRNTGWSNTQYRTAEEYELMGEYPGRNAGLFASNLPAPVLIPAGYRAVDSVLAPRQQRRARYAVQTE